MPDLDLAVEHLRMTVTTARAVDASQSVVMVSELTTVLDELNRLRLIEEHDRSAARRVAAEWAAGGQCGACGCCIASGCHRFADSTCPTDQLGDSICPCTEA